MPNAVTRLDRIQIATVDVDVAARRWIELFDAEPGGRDTVECLGAERLVVRLLESEVELLQPSGAGPVRDFVERWRDGLFAVGFSAVDPSLVREVLESARVPVRAEREQLFAGPTTPGSLRLVVSADNATARVRVPEALLRHVYEVTNPVGDEPSATAFYAQALGLDSSRFQPIASRLYGYTGTLTLLDPPQSLDRIEVTQTYGDGAMHRFFERRGEGPLHVLCRNRPLRCTPATSRCRRRALCPAGPARPRRPAERAVRAPEVPRRRSARRERDGRRLGVVVRATARHALTSRL